MDNITNPLSILISTILNLPYFTSQVNTIISMTITAIIPKFEYLNLKKKKKKKAIKLNKISPNCISIILIPQMLEYQHQPHPS